MARRRWQFGGKTASEIEFNVIDANVVLNTSTDDYTLTYDHITDDDDIACSLGLINLGTYINFSVHFDVTFGADITPGQRVDIWGTNSGLGGISSLRLDTDGTVSMVMGANLTNSIWTPVASTKYRVEVRRDSTLLNKLQLRVYNTSDVLILEDDIDDDTPGTTIDGTMHWGHLDKGAEGVDPAVELTVTNFAIEVIDSTDTTNLPIWWNNTDVTYATMDGGGNHNDLESGRSVFIDRFSGNILADQTLTVHPPDLGTGWTVLAQVNAGLMEVLQSANTADAETVSGNTGVIYTADATYPSADYMVWCDPSTVVNAPDVMYIAGRIADSSNFYAIEIADDVCQLYSVVAGVWSALGSDHGLVLQANSDVQLRMVGTTISMRIDGIEFESVTNSDHASAGKAGIGMGANRTATDDMDGGQKFNEFFVYDLKNDALEENVDEVPGAALDENFNIAGQLADTTYKQSHAIANTSPSGTIKGLTLFSTVANQTGSKQLVREDGVDFLDPYDGVFHHQGFAAMPSGNSFTSGDINALEMGSEETAASLSTGDIGSTAGDIDMEFNADGGDDGQFTITGGTPGLAHSVLGDNNGSTYIESNTVGHRQSLKAGRFDPGENLVDEIIIGIEMLMFFASGHTGDGEVKMYYKDSGGVRRYSDTYTVGSTRRFRWGLNPETSAPWTRQEAVDNEWGYEIVTADSTHIRIALGQIEFFVQGQVRERAHWITIGHGDAPTEFSLPSPAGGSLPMMGVGCWFLFVFLINLLM